MPEFAPDRLAADAGGQWRNAPRRPITGFSIDSRTLREGELFVALKTKQRDGHDYLRAALERGAAGALVSRRDDSLPLAQLEVVDSLAALQKIAGLHRRRFHGPVIGVTGSVGKTSTKNLLATLLGEPKEVAATEGNLNNHLGVPLTLLRIDHERHRVAVVEAGISGVGEMAVIASLIAPDVAVITAIGAAHLEGLESVDGVAREKAILASQVSDQGAVVMTAATYQFAPFRSLDAQSVVLTGVADGHNEVGIRDRLVPFAVKHDSGQTEVCVSWHGEVDDFVVPPTTTGLATNLALAVATARHLGVTSDDIRRRLISWRPSAMRGEVCHDNGRLVFLDCYNANPLSMRDAVAGFVRMAPAGKPRLFVVGCMEELGEAADELHRAMGRDWPMREHDQMIALGSHAPAMVDGLHASQPHAEALVDPDRSSVADIIRRFPGSIFLKGSRRYALEELFRLPSSPTTDDAEVAA